MVTRWEFPRQIPDDGVSRRVDARRAGHRLAPLGRTPPYTITGVASGRQMRAFDVALWAWSRPAPLRQPRPTPGHSDPPLCGPAPVRHPGWRPNANSRPASWPVLRAAAVFTVLMISGRWARRVVIDYEKTYAYGHHYGYRAQVQAPAEERATVQRLPAKIGHRGSPCCASQVATAPLAAKSACLVVTCDVCNGDLGNWKAARHLMRVARLIRMIVQS